MEKTLELLRLLAEIGQDERQPLYKRLSACRLGMEIAENWKNDRMPANMRGVIDKPWELQIKDFKNEYDRNN